MRISFVWGETCMCLSAWALCPCRTCAASFVCYCVNGPKFLGLFALTATAFFCSLLNARARTHKHNKQDSLFGRKKLCLYYRYCNVCPRSSSEQRCAYLPPRNVRRRTRIGAATIAVNRPPTLYYYCLVAHAHRLRAPSPLA